MNDRIPSPDRDPAEVGEAPQRFSRRKPRYEKDLPKRLYRFFLRCVSSGELPSLGKFARENRLTLEELKSFESRKEMARAVRECNEIRRDYLIDQALCKRADSSLVKFLLVAEYGMGEKSESGEDDLSVTLTVVKS